MTIKFENCFYQSTECREAWITRLQDKKSRRVTVWIPGYQYLESINEQLKKRGLRIDLR
mgnify:CR=1 FL=1